MDSWLVFAFSVAFGGLIGGVGAQLVRDWAQARRIDALEGAHLRLQNTVFGTRGRSAQAEQGEELEAAVVEVITAVRGGKPVVDAVKEVVARHPSVALRLAKHHMNL